jgi:hypothetical protein
MPEIVIKAAIVVLALAAAVGVKYGLGWKDDNPVEEIAETVIENEVGYDLDLTPATQES